MEEVLLERPDGAVVRATRKTWESVYRSRGFKELEPVRPNPCVRFLMSDTKGGGRIRSQWPSDAMLRLGYNSKATMAWPGMATGGVAIIHRPIPSDDHPEEVLDWIRSYQKAGIAILVDEDDDIGRIPSTNTWQATRQQIKFHDQAIREADGLLVTTERLREIYGPLAKRVWRVPNFIPARVSPELATAPRPSRVTVGWAGVINTHLHDLKWFAPEASRALQDAYFVSVGDKRIIDVFNLDRGRCQVASWADGEMDFYRLMGRADIGIVPLKPILFNHGKSNLKAREFIALGKPVVVPALPDQVELLSGTGAGLLTHPDRPKEFADAVQSLVHDSALRESMTEAALRLRERLTLEANIDTWVKPIEEARAGV